MTATTEATHWRRCSTCKEGLPFEALYFRCSVSTCNRKRTALYFCSVACWDAHQADARHRDAGAEEARAPTRREWERELAEIRAKAEPAREPDAPQTKVVKGAAARDVLVVAARFKDYIRERAGMSTSDRAFGVLSDHLRELADRAVAAAARDGRRTIMDRDIAPLVAGGSGSFATGAREVDDRPDEVLVVVTKFKQYVKARSDMNTSDGVMPVLSAHLRRLARKAIRHAATSDRKTVLDRDFIAAGAR